MTEQCMQQIRRREASWALLHSQRSTSTTVPAARGCHEVSSVVNTWKCTSEIEPAGPFQRLSAPPRPLLRHKGARRTPRLVTLGYSLDHRALRVNSKTLVPLLNSSAQMKILSGVAGYRPDRNEQGNQSSKAPLVLANKSKRD